MEPVITYHKVDSEAQDFRVLEAETPASFSLHELIAELLNGKQSEKINKELFESNPERFCPLFDAYSTLLKEQGAFNNQAQMICRLVKHQIIFCKNSKLRERFVAAMQDLIWQSTSSFISSTIDAGFHIACMPPQERVKAVQHLYNQQAIWEKDLVYFANELICYIGALEGPIGGEENSALCKILAKWLIEKEFRSHLSDADADGMQRLLNIFTSDYRFKEYGNFRQQNGAAGLLLASGYQPIQSSEFLDALAFAWCRNSSIPSKPLSPKIASNAINQLLNYIEPREEDLILLFRNGGYIFNMTPNSREKLIQQLVNDPMLAEEVLKENLKNNHFNFDCTLLLNTITGVNAKLQCTSFDKLYFAEALPQEPLERAGRLMSNNGVYVSNEIRMRIAKRLPIEQALSILDCLQKPITGSCVCDFVEICQNLDLAQTEKILSYLNEPERRRAWLYLALGGTQGHQEYAATLFEREPLGSFVSSNPDEGPPLFKITRF